jgi:flagellar biosynthesis protein FliR
MTPSFAELQALAPWVGLLSIRIGVMFAALPSPFGALTPVTIRAALSVLLALAISLAHRGQPLSVDVTSISVISAIYGEICVGTVIGLTARVILAAAESAGSIAGTSMGLGFAETVDPDFGMGALPTTRVIGLLGTLIFLIFRGHHALIQALASSVTIAEPGRVFSVLSARGPMALGNSMLARGLQIAAPVVGTMFIIQLGTALISKAAPRVQFFAFSFAISAAAGLISLFISAPAIVTAISAQVRGLPAALLAALGVS